VTKEIAVKPLDKDEARAFVESIKSRFGDMRAMFIELHDRMGWTALGYSSWDELVKKEFTWWSKSYVNRQLSAGKIEQKLLPAPTGGSKRPIGTLPPPVGVDPVPESHMRPLAGLNEKQQAKAYTEAKAAADKAGKPLTAKDVKAKADAYKPAVPKPETKKCPDCGGEDLHDDGSCASCPQPDAPEPTVEELMTASNKALESLAREITGMHKRAGELGTPHLDEERLGIFKSQLQTAAGTLRAAKGFATCSYCEGSGRRSGKKCKPCMGCGWLTKTQADSAPEKG
jgi:hypothetical protein